MSDSPPNLRMTQGDESCGDCVHATEGGLFCTRYGNYPVEPTLVCDSFVPDPENELDG